MIKRDRRGMHRFTDEQIMDIRKSHIEGCTIKDLVVKYNASENAVSRIVQNISYHDKSFTPRVRSRHVKKSNNTCSDV
jgi:Mor family transcriptional regulator